MEIQKYQSDCVSENGIIREEEFNRYKNRSIAVKFKQQLLLGIGGATVFGLAGTAGSALLHVIGSGATAPLLLGLSAPILGWIGLGALALVGLSCIYFGSRFMSENILMDQDFQAKKIGFAARAVNQPLEQEKAATTPPGMSAVQEDKEPEEVKTAAPKQWAANLAAKDTSQGWADAVAAQQPAENQAAVRA